MPKVNFFTWLVMHMMVLTSDNLEKRGFYGPYRCCFCHIAVETSDHLLVDCIFTQQEWVLILKGLPVYAPMNIETINLFLNWKSIYPRIGSISPEWSNIWQAIPKFIWWKI